MAKSEKNRTIVWPGSSFFSLLSCSWRIQKNLFGHSLASTYSQQQKAWLVRKEEVSPFRGMFKWCHIAGQHSYEFIIKPKEKLSQFAFIMRVNDARARVLRISLSPSHVCPLPPSSSPIENIKVWFLSGGKITIFFFSVGLAESRPESA